jgi:hypothetical protein
MVLKELIRLDQASIGIEIYSLRGMQVVPDPIEQNDAFAGTTMTEFQ